MELIGDRVAVIPIEDPDVTESGIHIPKQAKQRVDQGIVKYRGPDTKDVRVGDHVAFSGYTGIKISTAVDGILFIMPEDGILAILEDGDEYALSRSTLINILYELYPVEDARKIIERIDSHVFSEGFEF